jgi:hypothetical protein
MAIYPHYLLDKSTGGMIYHSPNIHISIAADQEWSRNCLLCLVPDGVHAKIQGSVVQGSAAAK